MIKISIPATSSILGVGSTCLAMALQERFEMYVHQGQSEHSDDIMYEAFYKTLAYMGVSKMYVSFEVVKQFTSKDVFGCRSAHILAGCIAANVLHGNRLNKYEILNIACAMDPYAMHIAPALFGGLCVTFMYDEQPTMIRYGVKRDWVFLCIIPDENVEGIAKSQDEAVQMGQICALAKGIEIGNALVVKKAIGTPKVSDMYKDIVDTCAQYPNVICSVSEDQSGCFVFVQDIQFATTMKEQLEKQYPSWQISLQTSTYDGAYVEEV